MTSIRRYLLCLTLILTLSRYDAFEDSIIKTTFSYEYDAYSAEEQEGKAIVAIEALKNAKGHPLLSLTSVLDISESMDTTHDVKLGEKTRLEFLKIANRYMVDRLARQPEMHKLGTVTFSTDVDELTSLRKVTEESAEAIKKKIDGVVANGYTNLHGGIIRGIEQQRSGQRDRLRAVLLFTDGMPTTGKYLDSSAIVKSVEAALKEAGDVVIHVIAIGETINYDLLKNIAGVGGGVFYHVVEDEDIPKAFAAMLGGLLTETALNLSLTIDPVGDIVIKNARMNGGAIRWENNSVTVGVGNLLLEEKRRVIIDYQLSSNSKSVDGLNVRGKYENALTRDFVTFLNPIFFAKRVVDVGVRPTAVADVGWWEFRYEVCQWLEVAAHHLEWGENSEAVAELVDVKTKITKSVYGNRPYTQLMLEDLITFYQYLTRDEEGTATAKDRGMLDGLISVIGGGRPSSVDLVFNIVYEEETTITRTFILEVDAYVKGEEPKPLFEMEYTHAVNYLGGKNKNEYQVQLTLEPPSISDDVPLSLTVIIDKDEEAEGGDDTYKKMIVTLKKIIGDLKDHSHVSLGIVLSSGSAKTVLNLKKTSEIDVDALLARIDAFEAVGETALDEAIKLAVDQQVNHKIAGGSQAVFVITDGTPVNGDDIVLHVKKQLDGAGQSINFHTFGFDGSDDDLLQTLANISDGAYHRLYYTEDVGIEVGSTLWGLLKIGAKNINIRVRSSKSSITIANSLPRLDEVKGEWTTTFRDIYQGEKRDVVMIIEAPRSATDLIEIEIVYTDVLKPELRTSDSFTVKTVGRGSTGLTGSESIFGRILDQKVVSTLLASIKGGLTQSRVSYVMDTIYRVIRVVVNEKKVDKSYKADLRVDLEMIALKLDNARGGSDKDIREAEWILELFTQMLGTQRWPGSSHIQFKVQKRYIQPVIQRRAEIYKFPRSKVPANLPDPFEITFVNVYNEITTEEQDIFIKVKLKAADLKKELLLHSSHVFLIDATQSTTEEEIAKAKEGVLSKWKAMQNSSVSQTSHIVIMAYGNEVSTLLEKKLVSEITEGDITNAFGSLKPAGAGSFIEAVTAAVDVVAKIRAKDALDDVNLIVFVGDSYKFSKRQADAEVFIREVEKLDFPMTFVPVLLKEHANISYFMVYPEWVQLSIGFVKYWIMHSATGFRQPIVKRLIVNPNPAPGVEIEGMTYALKSEEGYYLADLFGSDERTYFFQLTLSASDSPQILRMPRFVMWDMRQQKERIIHAEPLSITRTSRKVFSNRINIEKEVKRLVTEINKWLEVGNWDRVLVITSKAISIIDESDIDSDNFNIIRDKLWNLGEAIYQIVGGDGGDVTVVKKIIMEVRTILIIEEVPKVIPSKTKSKPLTDVSDRKVVFPPDETGKTPDPPILVIEPGVRVRTSKKNVTINVQIKGTQQSGELVTARAIILLDASSNADWERQQLLALELLKSLASRQGKRSVEIWRWSDTVNQIYTMDDFGLKHLEEAKDILGAVALKGQADATKVLEHVQSIKVERDVITVIYWVAASPVPNIKDSVLSEYTATLKRHTTKTVMTFKMDRKGEYSKVMKQIGDLTGGWSYFIQQEASPEEVLRQIQNAGWTSVGWIEKTYIKNVVVRVTGRRGAVVSKIQTEEDVGITNKGLMIPSLSYDKDLDVKILVQLDQMKGKKAGHRDLLSITTEYVFVRMPYSRQLEEERVVDIELLEKPTLAKVDALNSLLDRVGEYVFYYLGRNQIEEARVMVSEVAFQPDLAGLKDRQDVKDRVQIYESIEGDLEEYVMDRTNYGLLGKMMNRIVTSTTEKKYSVETTPYLRIRHGPLSLDENTSHFRARITIEAPSRKRPALWETEKIGQEVIAIAAVFDAAHYKIKIDGEIPPLLVQKMTINRLLKELVKSHYIVELNVIASYRGGSHSLPVRRFNHKNVGEVMKHLMRIEEKGTPSNLLSGLRNGLPSIQNAEDADRLVLLFTHASSAGLVEESAYEKLLMPHITPPINPVKVLTYILGKYETTGSDMISDLTGGFRMNIKHVQHIPRAVRASVDNINSDKARSIRLEVTPAEWYKKGVKLSNQGRTLRAGILGDMKYKSRQSIDLALDLGKWSGDKDIFDYTVSYYSPKDRRWYWTASNTFRLRRARKEVVKEHSHLKVNVTNTLSFAVEQLDRGTVQTAYVAVHNALGTVHSSVYQDDSLICSYSKCLMQTYDEIRRLSETGSKDARAIVKTLKNDGCHLELDVKENTRMIMATGGDIPMDTPPQFESPWYGFVF